nr:MAG TPA: hypothetical protein [Caudoviricetes sp.]
MAFYFLSGAMSVENEQIQKQEKRKERGSK